MRAKVRERCGANGKSAAGPVKSGSPSIRRAWLPPCLALAVTAVAWAPLFIEKVTAHQPNVDDYFYTRLADNLWHGNPLHLWGILHTGQTAPLVLALAAPFAQVGGVEGATAVELGLLLLLVAGAYMLARVWLSPWQASVAALVVGLNQAVLGWALMLNFTVAATGALLWALATYLHSDRLKTWPWSIGFGISVAALLLARSLAPAYVVPLALVIAIDLVLDLRKAGYRQRPWLPPVVSGAVVLVLAGPWWVVSGRVALHYLRSTGYETSVGFTHHSASLSPHTMWARLADTMNDLGLPQTIGLALAAVIAVGGLTVFRRHLQVRGMLLPLCWLILCFLVLSTSSTAGTGFGLPLLATLIVLVSAVLGQLGWRSLLIPRLVVVVVLSVGYAAEVTGGESLWWLGPPYRTMALQAGGSRRTNIDELHRQVVSVIRNATTIVARDDDLLNVEGLMWVDPHLRLVVPPYGPASTVDAIGELKQASMLIVGTTLSPYHTWLNDHTLEVAAERAGFKPLVHWYPGPHNSIIVWKRQ